VLRQREREWNCKSKVVSCTYSRRGVREHQKEYTRILGATIEKKYVAVNKASERESEKKAKNINGKLKWDKNLIGGGELGSRRIMNPVEGLTKVRETKKIPKKTKEEK